MKVVPFTRVAGVLPVYRFLESIGAPAERIAERAGLSTARFERPDELVPFHAACRFYGAAARAEGIESLGALLGMTAPVWDLGSYGAALCGHETIYDVMLTAARLLPRFSSAYNCWMREDGQQVWFCERIASGNEAGADQVDAFGIAMIVNRARTALGPDWRPERMRVPARARSALRGVEVFSDVRIDLTRDVLAVPIPRNLLPTLWPSARGEKPDDSEERVRRSAPPTDFVASVETLIRIMTGDPAPTVKRVAAAAGMSARSLQRRLADAGLTFSELVARTRLSYARELLSDPTLRTIDVAFELGYADPANFTRAFRRWTGVSPREYRWARVDSRT